MLSLFNWGELKIIELHHRNWDTINFDEFVKSHESSVFVIPEKAGIQETQPLVDSRVRGSDGHRDFLRSHQF